MKRITQTHSAQKLMALAMVALLVCASLTLAACSTEQPVQGEQKSKIAEVEEKEAIGTATLTIDSASIEGGQVQTVDLTVNEGDTAFDLLDKSDFAFNAEDSPYGMYVTMVENLSEQEHGSMSGWLLFVNDVSAEVAADNLVISDGDKVAWKYSTGEEWME